MKIQFYKYHGTGNDFVIIDNRKNEFDVNNQALIKNICNRRFGIGADGLILLNLHSDYDFEMKYFNSDGLEGSMCGNGGRCIVAFANKLGLCDKSTVFMAFDGVHNAEISGDIVNLKMSDVQKPERILNGFFLNTGSPHYVEIVDNTDELDVFSLGRNIRLSEDFKPDGTNVNFLSLINNVLKLRTYERGVEQETFSCGTGAIASAIVASEFFKNVSNPVSLAVKGGQLIVHFKKNDDNYTDVWLQGSASFVFEGSF